MSVHSVIAPPRVEQTDINDARQAAAIDAFVRAHAASTPFHLTAWSRAIARGCAQAPLYLVSKAGQSIAGVLPLTIVHSPLFGRALVSVGFAVGGGVLADNDAVAAQLIAAATAAARRWSCGTVEIKGGAIPADWHIDATTYVGFVRPLAGDADAELTAIPRKQRAEVRRALGLALTTDTGRDDRARAAHYAVYSASVHNLGTPVFPRALFSAVLDEFGTDADILTVWHDGTPVASVLSLYHKGAVMPYWGGGTGAARDLRANEMMYYALMNHARDRGARLFDFGRSKVGTGAAAYKKNWGFEPQPLRYGKLSVDGRPLRSINPLDPQFSRKVQLWQNLPLGLANRIGPFIAAGLG